MHPLMHSSGGGGGVKRIQLERPYLCKLGLDCIRCSVGTVCHVERVGLVGAAGITSRNELWDWKLEINSG